MILPAIPILIALGVRDVLRLKATGVSGDETARRVGVELSIVQLTLQELVTAG